MRAKKEAKFARTKAKCSKKKAEEEAYDSGVAETQAALKAQVPGVCKLYCSQVWNEALKQAGVDALSDLWKADHVFYSLAIRKDATPSSEVRDTPKEVEAASPGATLAITSPEVSAKGQDPDAPKETVGFVGDASVSHVEGLVIVVEPFQSIPLGEGSKDPDISPVQVSNEGVEAKSKE